YVRHHTRSHPLDRESERHHGRVRQTDVRLLVVPITPAWHSVCSMRGSSRQRFYVEEHGKGEPLLLLEGLGQSLWAWREQIPVFADHFRTIAFDTRGTGRSPVPDVPYGIDELTQDAADVLGGRKAHIVGLS